MFDEFDPDPSMMSALGALMAGASADQNLNLAALTRRQAPLCARLRKFDFVAVLEKLSGLLVQPANHVATFRIEALIHLAAIHCRGSRRPELSQCREWLNEILVQDDLGRGEDPAEDVFVTTAPSFGGDARIFEGAWEDAGGYLTDLMNALLQLRGRPWADQTLEEVTSLVWLSENIADRAGVRRYATGDGQPRQPVAVTARSTEFGAAAVTFDVQELLRLGLTAVALRPFEFQRDQTSALEGQTLGHTDLERRPLVRDGRRVIVALPTAISAAARRHILEAAHAAGDLQALQTILDALQLEETWQALRNIGVKQDAPPKALAPGIFALTGAFDEGAHAIGVLVTDRLEEVLGDGLQGVMMLMSTLEESVSKLERERAERPGYRRGLTLVVRGGVGRGYAAGFSDDPPGWRRTSIPLGDLRRLSWDHEFSAMRIWKLREQEETLEQKKFTLMNVNGFLNLYGYLEQTRFSFVPEQSGPSAFVMLATDYIGQLRARVRHALDEHRALGPDGVGLVDVQRRAPDVYFEELRGLPLYVAHKEAQRDGGMLACLETDIRPWWVGLADTGSGKRAIGLAFRIWDAAGNWLVRLAPRLEAELPDLPEAPLAIWLDFPDIDDWSEERALAEASAARPSVEIVEGAIVVRTDEAALRAYSDPTNIGDRALIAAIALGAAELAGAPRDTAWADALAGEIVGSDEARFVHAIPTSTAQQMIQAALPHPKPRLIEDEDVAWSRLDLAALAGRPAPGPVPTGEESDLLHAAVLHLWERIRAKLVTLDRRSVVERALLNHEAVDKDRAEWGHTAAALLSLYRDQVDVVRAHNERESMRAAAGTASRAIVEMAVCACPTEGGSPCTDIDLDGLLADLAVMLDCAAQSDAYHYRLAEAPLKVANNRAFVFDFGFLQNLHQPYLYAQQERSFRDTAEDYAEPFERARTSADARPPSLPDGFRAAMRAEFGMCVEDLVAFAVETAETALQAGQPILVFPKSEILARLRGGERLEPVDAEAAFAALTLRPRSPWNDPAPAGAKARDWQPWRMNRKLALIRRPLVQLDDSADPPVMVTPGLLDRAVRRSLDTLDGRLPAEAFDSDAMEKWIGTIVDERGHAFNHRVADALKAQGFEARPDVKLTELGGGKVLGDVDVLAWSASTGEVWLIECKRLVMDRTVGEIGERLADYTTRGKKKNGKRTPIQRHLDRIVFLQGAPAGLTAITGIPADRLQIRSALVTDSIVPMQFTSRMLDLVDRVTDYRTLAKDFAAQIAP